MVASPVRVGKGEHLVVESRVSSRCLQLPEGLGLPGLGGQGQQVPSRFLNVSLIGRDRACVLEAQLGPEREAGSCTHRAGPSTGLYRPSGASLTPSSCISQSQPHSDVPNTTSAPKIQAPACQPSFTYSGSEPAPWSQLGFQSRFCPFPAVWPQVDYITSLSLFLHL